MESKGLDAIKDQLLQEQGQIRAKAQSLRSELQAMDANLERIDAAIAALDGSHLGSRHPRAAASKERKKITSPAASKADVVKIMQALLQEEGQMTEDELRSALEGRLKEDGFTLMGFSLRFKEAKADEQFAKSADGITLRNSTEAASKTK